MHDSLEVKNLCKKYNEFELKNINLKLPKGMIMGLIGENGAEKGRIQMFIVAAIIILLISGIFLVGENANINLPISDILNTIINFLPVILILATLIIYYISYRVSYRIYKNKEE